MPERARVPVVVTVHDLTFFDHPEWHQPVKVRLFRRAIRVAARRAAAVVCVSRLTAERFEARCQPRAPIFVVPHGVDHDRFRPDEPRRGADDAELAAIGVRAPFVLFLGTLEPRKAVPQLVAAFDRLAGAHPELSLVLAGQRGWSNGPVDRAIAAARQGGRIVRTGFVPEDAVPALLRQASVVAYPALDEGFGLPALEALACGAPVVTTSGTAMAEMAGEGAIVVPPGSVERLTEALEAAVTGGSEVERHRLAGLVVAARYTWSACAEGHLAAYRRVLSR
jgi:glycosyltransferase involved in cell wall biosynthesis